RFRHGTVRGMRHLWTLIAAVVIAPAAWLLMAYGQPQAADAFAKSAQAGTWHANDFLWPLLFLAGAGLLLGLLATLRFSPLGEVTLEGEQGGEETKDFWNPTTPATTPLGSGFDDPTTERVVPGQFGSPWRTPPGESTTTEEQSR